MDRNRATREAFDGVELLLPSGRAVKSAALTVKEAVGFMSSPVTLEEGEGLTEEQMRAIGAHLRAFCERIGVIDLELTEFGLELGGLTVRRALEIAEKQGLASDLPDTVAGADALLWLLDEVPAELHLEDPTPSDVFEEARVLRVELYRHLDWLLRRFCTVLTMSPGVRAMELRAATSTLVLTT